MLPGVSCSISLLNRLFDGVYMTAVFIYSYIGHLVFECAHFSVLDRLIESVDSFMELCALI